MHTAREPFSASVDAVGSLTSDSLAALTAQLELLLYEIIAAHQLLRVVLPFLFDLHETGIVLMRLAAVLVEALDFLLEVGEGVEVMQPEELIADLFQDIEVGRPVSAHLICINYGVKFQLYTSIHPINLT